MALALVLICCGVLAAPAGATDILVTTTDDNLTGGDCLCTLREAVANANATSGSGDTTGGDCPAGDIAGADTIFVPAGVYSLSFLFFELTSEITIIGDGQDSTIIRDSTVSIQAAGVVDLFGLQIDPSASDGIRNRGGDVTLTSVLVTGATGGGASGAIRNDIATGTLTILDSRVSGNSSRGIRNLGIAFIMNSEISNNHTTHQYSAVYNQTNTAVVHLVNSTISGNIADNLGGAFANIFGTAFITNSTIVDNFGFSGGGFFGNANTFVRNSIIANNSDTHLTTGFDNCQLNGTVNLGGNFADDQGEVPLGGCAGFTQISTVDGVDLDHTLSANGGPTDTHALPAGSLAIDAGGVCAPFDPSLTADQRYAPRSDGACDSGSFEFGSTPPVVDHDGDGVPNATDNCPFNANPLQTDSDFNGRGDACDPGATPTCGPTCNDNDGDGYGNPGDASCDSGPETDCDDDNDQVFPGAHPETCNGIDDNCDGQIDEGFDQDDDGFTTCDGDCDDTDVSINPDAAEVCDDVDNDCDDSIDEGFDLDGDGFTTCGGDCNDDDASINPDAAEVCDLIDNDCSGTADDIAPVATTCGVGECAGNAGFETCVDGVLEESCDPFAGASTEVCDGADNDCDGTVDEDIAPVATICGVGECAGNTGELTCESGSLVDSCDPLAGASDDNQCDGLDNDCDGTEDDDYVAPETTCGVGECSDNTGLLTCESGNLVDTCDPLAGAVPDDQCDGLDNDCDGAEDEHYVPPVTGCGLGECSDNTGLLTCVAGSTVDTCDPLAGATTEVCDGLDNDCDGDTDEGFDADGDTIADCFDICPLDPFNDGDGDGVCGDVDVCADTVIPESVPTVELKPNRWALVDGDFNFDTVSKGKGKGPGRSYTTGETGGCSCEQIIEICGYGQGHTKFGCSISVMDTWTGLFDAEGEAPFQCH